MCEYFYNVLHNHRGVLSLGKRRKPQAGAGGQGAGRGVTGGRKIRGVTRGSKLPVRGRSKQH